MTRNLISGPSVLHLLLHLTLSTHFLATTMAPKYTCYCFKCNSRKEVTRKTLYSHLRQNQEHLDHLLESGADQDTVDFVQQCNYQMLHLLNVLAEGAPSGQPGSSHSAGKCYIFL
jgi:hypothetical protein